MNDQTIAKEPPAVRLERSLCDLHNIILSLEDLATRVVEGEDVPVQEQNTPIPTRAIGVLIHEIPQDLDEMRERTKSAISKITDTFFVS